jgi:hypothetical protein
MLLIRAANIVLSKPLDSRMEPISPGQLQDKISGVTVTFEDTQEVLPLDTRMGSANHFFPTFICGVDEIQLRLDWTDIDNNGQPRLDADFIDPSTGKHRAIKGKRKDTHHTDATPGGSREYKFEFNGFSRCFTVAVGWRETVAEVIHLEDSCDAEIIQGDGSGEKRKLS